MVVLLFIVMVVAVRGQLWCGGIGSGGSSGGGSERPVLVGSGCGGSERLGGQ